MVVAAPGVQVHGDDVVGPGDAQHVGHQLGRDGRPGLVLLVLAGVGEAGDHRGHLHTSTLIRLGS